MTIDEIKLVHARIADRFAERGLDVGAVVGVPISLQMNHGQMGLRSVMADEHGRLWAYCGTDSCGDEQLWKLIHDHPNAHPLLAGLQALQDRLMEPDRER